MWSRCANRLCGNADILTSAFSAIATVIFISFTVKRLLNKGRRRFIHKVGFTHKTAYGPHSVLVSAKSCYFYVGACVSGFIAKIHRT